MGRCSTKKPILNIENFDEFILIEKKLGFQYMDCKELFENLKDYLANGTTTIPELCEIFTGT